MNTFVLDNSIAMHWVLGANKPADQRGDLITVELDRFISQLESLPIITDTSTSNQAFSRTLSLAKAYKLSSYDAAYLELAIRESLPLETLDKNLLKAAKKLKLKFI